jgi:CheY-like chemotaxis protein
LVSELTISEQRERGRLAKMLHDNLQQLLVAAKFRLVDLKNHADPVVQGAKDAIEKLLDESIQMSRSLTAELSPPVLHEHGLSAGLEWLARWMAKKHGIAVEMSIRGDVPQLPEAVSILLFESTRELLFNAVKHAGVKEVAVSLQCLENGQLRIIVSDSGLGFDPKKVKEPGDRGGAFGLFSIQERLMLIGGRMEIDSSPGKGSRIILTTPEGEPGTSAQKPKSELRPAVQRTLSKLGAPIRVLLADDHMVIREGLARLLIREPDIEVLPEAASNGVEAVELAAKLLPDVMLMDISMPKMNGIEATKAIAGSHPEIHIIGLSMFEQSEREEALLNAGAVKYLSKCGPSAELIDAIRTSIVG